MGNKKMKAKISAKSMFLVVASLFVLTSCSDFLDQITGGDAAFCTGDWNTCKAFYDGKLAVKNDTKWGYVAPDGTTAIDFEFDKTAAFASGIALVKVGTMHNIIDSRGKLLLETGYERLVRDVAAGIIMYRHNAKWGLLSENGNRITEPLYDTMASYFSEGLLAVSNAIGAGYIDKSGNVKIPLEYQETYTFTQGLGLVMANNLYGYINAENDMAINATYLDGYSFDDYDRAIVQIDDVTFGLIDKSGSVLLTADDIIGSGPLYETEIDYGTYMLHDVNGNPFTSQTYTYVNVYEGYLVNIEWEEGEDDFDKTVLFNADGTIQYAFDYDYADWVVGTDGVAYVIDETDGLDIYSSADTYSLEGDYVMMITEDYIVYNDGTACGIITKSTNPETVVPFEYNNILLLSDDYAIVAQAYRFGVVDLNGEIVVPCEYTDFNFLVNL